jgi:hypothetical protein
VLRECRRPILALLAAGALAAPLGGCGDSDDEPATSADESTTTSTAEGAPAEVTPLRRQLEQELRRLIVSGGAKVDADCVIDQLRTTLSNETVEAAAKAAKRGEEIPKEAVDAAYDAGRQCARR